MLLHKHLANFVWQRSIRRQLIDFFYKSSMSYFHTVNMPWYEGIHSCRKQFITMTSQWARWLLKSPVSPFSNVCSGAGQRKHHSSASLASVLGSQRWPVNFPHKWPVTRIIFPFDDVIFIIKPQRDCNDIDIPSSSERRCMDKIQAIYCIDL